MLAVVETYKFINEKYMPACILFQVLKVGTSCKKKYKIQLLALVLLILVLFLAR